jgi:chromosome segregation ATPase
VGMVDYIKVLDYIKQTRKNRSSVYRDIKRGKIKTTMIDGIMHIIVDDENNSSETPETGETSFRTRHETGGKVYHDAEIIEENREKYEIELFRTSIATLEDFASKIVDSKNETINVLEETVQRLNKNLDSLNETVKIVSKDNYELGKQIAIRETEVFMRDKQIEELETKLKQNEIELEQLRLNSKKLEEEKKKLGETLKDKSSLLDILNKTCKL